MSSFWFGCLWFVVGYFTGMLVLCLARFISPERLVHMEDD